MRPKKDVWDLEVADVEVGGDIHRIILHGIKNPAEACAHASRDKIFREYDALRRLMISYPYGHEDMCADLVFDSDKAEAAHGYVIMESMGYPYYSGSNTIATVAALLEYEIIPFSEGSSEIALDSPGGIVKAQYSIENNLIQEITVNGGAAYVISETETVSVPFYGTIEYSLIWSGAYYVMVDAASLEIKLDQSGIADMKKAGFAILETLKKDFKHEHQSYGKIDPPGFVHFMGEYTKTGDRHYTGRGATYGYPNTVFYCPTGTGTSARMALMAQRNQMESDATFINVSAMNNKFKGRGLGTEMSGSYKALATTISARPYVLATTRMHIDFSNPLMNDFLSLTGIMR